MAVTAFPALEPSGRTWVPGSQPVKSFVTLSGFESRVMLGSEPLGTSLQLSFQNLTEAAVIAITNHFGLAKGTFESFALPDEVFAGMATPDSVTPAGQVWRYTGPPSVAWVAPAIANVSVSFVSVRQ